MWKIGCSSRLLWEHKILDILKFVNKIGYDFIEIWAEHVDESLKSNAKLKEIKNLAEDLGLYIVIHAPFMDLNISSFNKIIRQESIHQVLDSCKLAYLLGSKKLVVHPGRMTMSKIPLKEFLDINYEALNYLIEEANIYNIIICLENMERRNKEYFILPKTLLQIIKKMNSRYLKICLDIAHANTSGQIKDFITELGNNIFHIHISDNEGHSPVHLPIGEGNIQFQEIFHALRSLNNREITIEGYIPGRCREIATLNLIRLKEILSSIN